MKLSLVVLAAGMGSRFGGLKQISPVGPSGESIIDYSIYDALRAGYDEVILIIREDIHDEFHEFFGTRLEKHLPVKYAFQKIDEKTMPGRLKPPGTAHAVLAASHLLTNPFSVINADDFYGYDAFKKAIQFFQSGPAENNHAVIGYQLEKTLSIHGSVSRAECAVDSNGYMTHIRELLKVYKEDKEIYFSRDGENHLIPNNTPVSMNFWCFQPSVIPYFKLYWEEFLKQTQSILKDEYLIPDVASSMIIEGSGSFKVIPTASDWFGITYKEDYDGVVSGILKLVENGEYPESLWT